MNKEFKASNSELNNYQIIQQKSGSVLVYEYLNIDQQVFDQERIILENSLVIPTSIVGVALSLYLDLFLKYWDKMNFGQCIPGAIFELSLPAKPQNITYRDGFLIIYLPNSAGHLHLAVNELTSASNFEIEKRVDLCKKIAFFKGFTAQSKSATDYGIRFWNGKNNQILNVFFGNDDEEGNFQVTDLHKEIWHNLKEKYT